MTGRLRNNHPDIRFRYNCLFSSSTSVRPREPTVEQVPDSPTEQQGHQDSQCHLDRVRHTLHVISTEQSVLFVISIGQSVLFVISTEAAGVMEKSGFDMVDAIRRPVPSSSLLWASLRMTGVRISPDAGDLKSRIDQMRKTREKSSHTHAKTCAHPRKNLRGDCAKSSIRPRKNLRTTNNTTITETIIDTIASPSPSPRSNEAPATLERRAADTCRHKCRVRKKKIGTTYVLG